MSWFYPDASKYLHNPLGQIVISDGRNYVRLSDKHYDLITIDSPPPIWSAGAVVLLTQEFYQEAAQRLTPGGVLTTYLALDPGAEEKMMLRTFRSVFPYMTVVYEPHNKARRRPYLLGSQAPIPSARPRSRRPSAARPRKPTWRAHPTPGPVHRLWVAKIPASVRMANNQVNAFTGPGPLLTDDRPLTEYFMLAGSVPPAREPAPPAAVPGRHRVARPAHHRRGGRRGTAEADPRWRRLAPG